MRSELNYAGKNLSEFGMWFDNSKVYKKPSKRFMGYDIPARNGTLYQSENKFNNVIIEFDCFIKDNFDQNYNDLVNYLNSFETYQKLVNSYNGNMYRMALFHEAIEVDTGQFLKDGRFKLFFDCKPQEYYADGAEFEHIASHYDTYTGDPAVVENEGESDVASLKVALEPIQTGSGDPSPTNVRPITGHTSASVTRTGKNLLNYINSRTSNGITYTYDSVTGAVHVSGTATSASWSDAGISATTIQPYAKLPAGTYIISGITGQAKARVQAWYEDGTNEILVSTVNGSAQFEITKTAWIYTRISVARDLTVDETIYPMIRLASDTNPTFEPYTGQTVTVDLNGTRYGGSLNVLTGVLTVTDGYIASYNSETLPSTWISDRDVYASGTTPTTGAQVVYKLATPTTINLTPQQISLLTGTNYISSSGEVTVITKTPLILKNPSPMTAKPVFKFTDITAPFTVSANGETIISFQNAITLIKYAVANNMTFNANGTTLTVTKTGTPAYTETSIMINSGYLPAGRYSFASATLGSLEVRSADGTETYSSGGTFTLTDITQVKIWYVITPSASTPQTFNMPIHLRPLGDLYVNSELMDCYMIDGDTAYSFNECVSLPQDFLELDDRTVITMTSGATGFIAPNWWRL